MGGQACVFYGAAEFSRDTDFAVFASPANLTRLRRALDALQAEVIAVPPFAVRYLRRGQAIHFRCRHPDVAGLRVDVMSRLRGVDAFPKLWARRTTLEMPDGTQCHLLSLPDLVQAKKTQRDKDWPMLRRLVEADYFQRRQQARSAQVQFWLRELQTPELLIEVVRAHPGLSQRFHLTRPAVAAAQAGNLAAVAQALDEEQRQEREADRRYWVPLRAELERLRHPRST